MKDAVKSQAYPLDLSSIKVSGSLDKRIQLSLNHIFKDAKRVLKGGTYANSGCGIGHIVEGTLTSRT